MTTCLVGAGFHERTDQRCLAGSAAAGDDERATVPAHGAGVDEQAALRARGRGELGVLLECRQKSVESDGLRDQARIAVQTAVRRIPQRAARGLEISEYRTSTSPAGAGVQP